MNKIKTSYGTIISFILIVSTILMPFSFLPKKAEAQSNIYGYTSGLAPAIARLPQCQKVMGSGIKTLFGGIGSLFSGETGGEMDGGVTNLPIKDKLPTMGTIESLKDTTPRDTVPMPSLDSISTSATIKIDSSPGTARTNTLLEEQLKELEKLEKTSKYINENSSCIQSIGRLIAKMLLQKMTMSTVNWINGGFDGSPSFIQNPGKFFEDIAKTQILQFGLEIQNNPYGADWLRNKALSYKNKFADNAQYSLNEMIQQTNPDYSATTFQTDFSLGGWDAWMAMTQIPANNPIGAKLMFDNEINKRLAGTSQSDAQNIRDALKEANGFLGDERCIDPKGLTRVEDEKIRNDKNIKADKYGYKEGTCKEWSYVTPGKMIADKATEVIGYENNSLLNVEDLNDAVAAVLDATLSHFSTSIYEKGFANIGYQGIDGVLVFSGANNGPYKTQTEKDFMPSHLSSSWLQENPEFDIRTDLTQALIDEQRTYSDKLALQNKELNSTTDGGEYKINTDVSSEYYGQSNAYGLMPAIYQLDYCIPGPHPGWENDSRETLREIVLPQEPKQSSNVAGEIVNGAVGVGLNFVPYVGPVLSSLFGALTGDDEAKRASTNARNFYTNQFDKLTGYSFQAIYGLGEDPKAANMSNSEGFFYVVNTTLDRYIDIMNKTYFSKNKLPLVVKDSAKEFNQLAGYNQIIRENKNKILEIKTTVNILGEIKDAVDNLNMELETGEKTEEEYEGALKFQINAFGRLSSNMVNGDDIAKADDLVKQIIAKKNYIYKNLLKGPYGCEADIEKLDSMPVNIKNFPSASPRGKVEQSSNDWNNYNVNSVKRMTYPFPIIYDYNVFAKGATLPDPWESGYAIDKLPKMPNENKYTELGPGFLSFVYFASSFANTHAYSGSERLHLGDIINNYDPCGEHGLYKNGEICYLTNITLGESSTYRGEPSRNRSIFEKTIGIY